jgi:glycosyltransferase involved in cell wall biosynthesis
MQTKLVSIIIPVFNLETYLEKCINSLIFQTHSSLEIIIIDDGSTDHSVQIIEKFAAQDSRIVLLKNDHQGTASARKSGIQYAKGDYITFVDGDDFFDQDSIEIMLSPFMSSECDIVVAQHRKVFMEEVIRYEYRSDYPFDVADSDHFMDIINERKDFTLWAKMFKTSLFEDIIFHEGVPIGQDGLVLKQVILKATIIKAVNKIVYNYLYRKGSAMRKSKLLINHLQFLKGGLNNLQFYSNLQYAKERDKLILYVIKLGASYLKMNFKERILYRSLWDDYVYPKELQLDFIKENPSWKNLDIIRKYPKSYSLKQLVPIYFNLIVKKVTSKK